MGGEYLLGDGERRRGGGEGVLRRGGGVGDLRRRGGGGGGGGGGAGEGDLRLLAGGERDFSSFYYEGKSLSGAFEVMERHSEKGNVSAACLPHRSLHGISWAAHLLRWKRSQSQMKTAGSAVGIVFSAAQNQLQPFCCLCLLQTQTAPLF